MCKLSRIGVMIQRIIHLHLACYSLVSCFISECTQNMMSNQFPTTDCSITSIVHGLYVWRIYSLFTKESLSPKTRYQMYGFVLLIAALSLCQFSCCVATSFFEALQYHQGPEKQFIARKLFHAWLASASIADAIITVVLVCKLNSIRTRLGVKATDDKIKKILYIIVPAGAAVSMKTKHHYKSNTNIFLSLFADCFLSNLDLGLAGHLSRRCILSIPHLQLE